MSNTVSTNHSTYPVKEDMDREFSINSEQYNILYKQSVEDNEVFGTEQACLLEWSIEI